MTGTAPGFHASDGVTPEQADRFGADLSRVCPQVDLSGPSPPLGLAVSGGADSLALLLLAHAAIPGRFEVATVDHGLRPEAAGECALVRDICRERGIACAILRVTCPPGNLQQEARLARYKALDDWARPRLFGIVTAHHLDDQAETLLMRLNRGSGLAGLAGMRPVSLLPGSAMTPLLRPLLGWDRAELAAIVAAAGIEPARDPSNADPKYDRVRIRQALDRADWLDRRAIARSAGLLGQAKEFIDYAVANDWADNVVREAELHRYRVRRAGEPRFRKPVAIGVVARILEQMGGTARGSEIARLTDALLEGKQGNLAGILARCDGDDWVFEPEPRRLH